MNKPVSFFAAVRGVFTGTAVFERLVLQSLPRAFAHLLLMIFCVSLVGASLGVWDDPLHLKSGVSGFKRVFGDIQVRGRSLLPTLEPERPREWSLPGVARIFYRPAGPGVSWKDSAEPVQIVWAPRYLVFAQENGEKCLASTVSFEQASATGYENLPRKSLGSYVESAAARFAGPPDAPGEDGGSVRLDVGSLVSTGMWCTLFFVLFLDQSFYLLVFLLVFVGVFRLTGGRNRSMTWREMVLTALYASFPVLPVASCFTVFQLPLLTYANAYLIGVIGYFLFAVNRIEAARRSSEGN